ncbi:MAG: RNase P subunit p30 family protein [Candidatus Odinarchaeota archaeon]
MSYFESRLLADIDNFTEVIEKLEFCEKLGIKNVILEPKDNLNIIPLDIKNKIKNITKLNTYFRINLRLNSLVDFKKRIKKYTNFSDILSIESFNKEVQLQAAKDSRVDIISFSNPEIIKTLTPGVISLTRQNNSFIEFSLSSIMIKSKIEQSKNFRNLYRFIQLALQCKADCIISGNFEFLFDLRPPRSLISICNSLLGIPLDKAKKIFRINPVLLLERTGKRRINRLNSEIRLIKGDEEL